LDLAAESFPFYYTPRTDLIDWISDSNLSLLAPIVAYWAYSLVFTVFDFSGWRWLEPYRLHEPPEVTSRNRCSMPEVIRAVLFQQSIQTVLGYVWIETPEQQNHVQAMQGLYARIANILQLALGPKSASQLLELHGSSVVSWTYWWIIPTFQFFFAIFVLDTWEYFLHRLFHQNKYLYRTFHSVHHRLYVPYAFGALYNHWFEGILLDTLGAAVAHSLSRMSVRQAILLFSFSTMKTVDDHCGYSLPFDPFQFFFPNNATYHDVHHQAWGIKYNFSQPFYIHWDTILGTRHPGRGASQKEKSKSE